MATEEEPEEADHYSNKNSQAADKQEEKDTNKPKVEGKNEESHRIIDNTASCQSAKPQEKCPFQPHSGFQTKPRRPNSVAEARQLRTKCFAQHTTLGQAVGTKSYPTSAMWAASSLPLPSGKTATCPTSKWNDNHSLKCERAVREPAPYDPLR